MHIWWSDIVNIQPKYLANYCSLFSQPNNWQSDKIFIPSLIYFNITLIAITFPAIVRQKGFHDHPMNNPAALQYREWVLERREKLIALFHQGHDPASVLHCVKTDLFQHGKKYYKFTNDGKFAPRASLVHHFCITNFLKNMDACQVRYCKIYIKN